VQIFLLWLLVIIVVLALYGFFLWRRSGKRTRFQSRLTLLFLAFVLLPTIPLVFLVSSLLNKSSEMILLPGVDRALNASLETIRRQLDEQAELFWRRHKDPLSLQTVDLQQNGLAYTGQVRLVPKQQTLFFKSLTSAVTAPSLSLADTAGAHLLQIGSHFYYEHYYRCTDSTLLFIGLPVSDNLLHTKEEILQALRNYSALSLLRDQFLQQGIIWTLAAILILTVSFLAVLTARWTARSLSEPIRLLTQGMQVVGDGNLSHRITANAKDEIGFLISSFNAMTQDLQTQRENLKAAERAAAWRDVARQISHEIKNPLTPMQLSLYRLKDTLPAELKNNPDIGESFRMLDEELYSLRHLADEFSQFARMPAPHLQPENINEVLRQSAKLFEAENSRARIILELDENLPPLALDREQMRRVFHNLLKNGLEASPNNEALTISTRCVDAERTTVEISIVDKGLGMDRQAQEKAFIPYFTTKKEGTGLGLTIVQRIVADHGGVIEIKSEHLRGTVVTIRLFVLRRDTASPSSISTFD
jgi:nitrogen fixation/metabolism regulation signal transduction histidine kinase